MDRYGYAYCYSCSEPFLPTDERWDPEELQWCEMAECQDERAEHEAWRDATIAIWNDNVRDPFMTSSERIVAQEALRAIWHAHPAAVAQMTAAVAL